MELNIKTLFAIVILLSLGWSFTWQWSGRTHPELDWTTMETEHWTALDLKKIRVLEWDRINFCTEEKKRRYAKFNGLSIAEVEEFRKQTRKNLGIYFIDQAKYERTEKFNKRESESKRWKAIRDTAAQQAAAALKTKASEVI